MILEMLVILVEYYMQNNTVDTNFEFLKILAARRDYDSLLQQLSHYPETERYKVINSSHEDSPSILKILAKHPSLAPWQQLFALLPVAERIAGINLVAKWCDKKVPITLLHLLFAYDCPEQILALLALLPAEARLPALQFKPASHYEFPFYDTLVVKLPTWNEKYKKSILELLPGGSWLCP